LPEAGLAVFLTGAQVVPPQPVPGPALKYGATPQIPVRLARHPGHQAGIAGCLPQQGQRQLKAPKPLGKALQIPQIIRIRLAGCRQIGGNRRQQSRRHIRPVPGHQHRPVAG